MPRGASDYPFSRSPSLTLRKATKSLDGTCRGKTYAGCSQCLRPFERLRSSEAYQRVRREGRRLRTPHFAITIAPNAMPYHRLGLVVQKRFWNHAVRRNRIKRCLREWFRLKKDQIPLPGKDIVVIAGRGAEALSPEAIAEELLPAVKRKADRATS